MLARRCGIAALQLNPISTAKNPFSLWLSATDITGIFLRKPSENCPTLPRTCVLMITSVSALGFKRDNLNQLVCPRCFVRQEHWFPVIPVTEVWLQQWHWFHSLSRDSCDRTCQWHFFCLVSGCWWHRLCSITSDTSQGIWHSALTKPNLVCKGNKAREEAEVREHQHQLYCQSTGQPLSWETKTPGAPLNIPLMSP